MRHLAIILFMISFGACQPVKKDSETPKTPLTVDDAMMETAIIYEANIRQYSPEGTFNAFTKDIPSLKNLGVKIIWLMPVHPISMTNRKAKGDLFVSDIKDPEEQKKYLGSYYSVSDYRGVSSDYGTKDDLRNLIKTAHENDMFVILDWVPNHTGWDHPWIKEHPEYYTKNAAGEITDPLNPDGTSMGWQDVADLNYENEGLRKAMIADMQYWISEEAIDGFRCDVAGSVPVTFWEECIPQLRKTKDIFMLAEAWEPELLKGKNLFDMCYGWDNHFLMVDIAKGKRNTTDWDSYMVRKDSMYEKDDIIMNIIENHDENSWKGTVKESFGDALEIMTVLSYMNPGMPLIYSGQEYDLDHQLKFFEKDSIPKTKGATYALFEKLANLKTSKIALNGGKNAANYTKIDANLNDKVLIFSREKEGQKMVFVGNLSAEPVEFTSNLEGTYKDALTGENTKWEKDTPISLGAWQYRILE